MLSQNNDILKELLRESVPEIIKAQMSELLNAESCEGTGGSLGFRSGYYR